jgi:transcriptional regulator with XRE-family HTH domain
MKGNRSILPPPEPGLRVLGLAVRAARVARGLTQQRLASAANVSRAQLALLEKGQNVSVAFLLKVAHHLELSSIPLDGHVELTSGGAGPDAVPLLETLDALGETVEQLRSMVMNAAAPETQARN